MGALVWVVAIIAAQLLGSAAALRREGRRVTFHAAATSGLGSPLYVIRAIRSDGIRAFRRADVLLFAACYSLIAALFLIAGINTLRSELASG